MKVLYCQQEFDNAKSNSLLKLECLNCKNIFLKTKRYIKDALGRKRNKKQENSGCFCSHKCFCEHRTKLKISVICKNCNKVIEIRNDFFKKSKNKNFFCNHSCHASFSNKNRQYGYRRSKIENWLETQLTTIYPNLEIQFNKKDVIGSELDIYIPSLKIAFELNGIFHYKSIYGDNKLKNIQKNDQLKLQLCINNKITLYIIDISQQKKFTILSSDIYLKIIKDIINNKLKTL